MRIAVVAAVLCLSMIGLSAADPAKASIRKDTHIPAGGLGPALHVLARQYDFQVLYRTEVVGSLRTRGAVGELSSEEALEQLLKGTGLTYRYLDQKTITILPLPTNPPATVAPPTGSTVSSSPDEYQPQSRSPWYKFLLAQTNERVAAEGVTSGQSESGPSPSPSESQPTQLEEVLVTANKIAEPSSRVPVSVSTVTGATLEQQQITNYADLSRAIPNISFTDYGGPGTSNIEIRGISSRAGSSTTGIYLDDVPLSDLNSYETGEAEPRFFDISRVEVLRGPQGTIYGASSMGGTIHFVSNRPDVDADSVRIHTQLGGTDGGGFNYEADSVVNVVLQPGVAAMRVGALYDHESGWIDRVDPNTGYNVTARNINDINTTVVRVAIDWRPNAALTVTPAVFLQRVSTGGQDTFGIGLPNFESPALVAQVARDEYAITSLTFNYDFGFSDLTAVTGYFWRDDDRTMDTTPEDSPYIGQLLQQQFGYGGATISALPAPGNYLANINQVHQEIRLASKPPGPDDRWSWIVGCITRGRVPRWSTLNTAGVQFDIRVALSHHPPGCIGRRLSQRLGLLRGQRVHVQPVCGVRPGRLQIDAGAQAHARSTLRDRSQQPGVHDRGIFWRRLAAAVLWQCEGRRHDTAGSALLRRIAFDDDLCIGGGGISRWGRRSARARAPVQRRPRIAGTDSCALLVRVAWTRSGAMSWVPRRARCRTRSSCRAHFSIYAGAICRATSSFRPARSTSWATRAAPTSKAWSSSSASAS